MRTLTAFLVTLLVLIGGGVALDAVLTQRAQRVVAERLGDQLGAEAAVQLGTWPVALRLLGGSVPRARVTLDDVPAGPVALTSVTAQLRAVRVEHGAAVALGLDGDGGLGLVADAGRLEADLDERAVSRLAGAAVRLSDGEATVVTGQGRHDVAVGLEGGAVVLRPVGAAPDDAPALRFDAPPLPGGARLAGVQLRGDALRLVADVRRLGG